jgi:RNA polymerase sigma-70 factor, ECF subfamily
MSTRPTPIHPAGPDVERTEQVVAGDRIAFEALIRRHNARLFRVARAILRDDAAAEDALQEAYLTAYRALGEFRGEARIDTWLTRIVINQALMALRRQRRDRVVVPFHGPGDTRDPAGEIADEQTESAPDAVLRGEMRRLLERRIDELPVAFRTVFVMREVEDLSVEETAACLGIPPATVRTRLFRARALLRDALARDVDLATGSVFGFAGDRCDRIVAAVLKKLEHA